MGFLIILLILGGLLLSSSRVRQALDTELTRWLRRQETRFDIPSRPLPLTGDVIVAKEHITVCNRGEGAWRNVILRVTNREFFDTTPTDLPLLGELTKLDAGACVDVPIADLSSPGWKKIPAPRDVNVVRVEILATITGVGYFSKPEK